MLALDLGVINDDGWNALIGVSIISIALNPTIYRIARKKSSSAAAITARTESAEEIEPERCILVGYGPIGRTVHRILSEYGADITVVELNMETVRELQRQGISAYYGDVLRAGTLEEVGIATAGSLIVSVEVEDAVELVRQVKKANPYIRIFVRCAHLREVADLRKAGATVVAGEAEIGVALAEALMIANEAEDRELAELRQSIRDRLYDSPAALAAR